MTSLWSGSYSMTGITYAVSTCVILLAQVTIGVNATDERRETSATIHLNSSYEGTGVCIGDRVVFRCTVIGPPLLQWVVESINTFNTKPIQFNVVTDMPGTIPDPFPEVTNVTLISVEQDTENPFQGALVSEITVLVTSTTLGKHVYCSHGQLGEQETPSILIQSATLPLPPLLTYSNISYGIDEYSVRVQWQTPSDDHGEADNYTLTLYRDKSMIEMSLLKANTVEHYVSLNYSTNYTFAVYTSNCIGSGNSTYIYIVKAGCGQPSAPVNGSIEEYRSTEEGAEIQFHCDEGYTPNEWNTSQCQDSVWSPDPQLLHCSSLLTYPSIDCGAPLITGNITVNFTTTMFGYNATYHCQGDPSEIYTTQCTSAGVWEPDPNALNCTDSKTLECNLSGSPSHILSLVVACVVTALITFPLGAVVSNGVCWCSKRYSHERCGLKKKKPVLPKSIELTDNPAYGHIHKSVS